MLGVHPGRAGDDAEGDVELALAGAGVGVVTDDDVANEDLEADAVGPLMWAAWLTGVRASAHGGGFLLNAFCAEWRGGAVSYATRAMYAISHGAKRPGAG